MEIPQRANEWPERVRISGMPFLLQGWNTVLQRGAFSDQGYPVYSVESYELYGLFSIAGMKLEFTDNKGWELMPYNTHPNFYKNGCNEIKDVNPLGSWSYGFCISEDKGYCSW